MTRINLLPWREELREERKRHFLIALGGCAAASVMVMLVVHLIMSGMVSDQQSRNKYLTSEIKLLDRKILEIKSLQKLKSALIARMNIIQELQSNRPQMVHLFDELVTVLPKGVYIQSLARKGDIVTIQGKADTNTSISKLMRNIEASPWLTHPMLNEIKTKKIDGKRNNNFTLHMLLVNNKGGFSINP